MKSFLAWLTTPARRALATAVLAALVTLAGLGGCAWLQPGLESLNDEFEKTSGALDLAQDDLSAARQVVADKTLAMEKMRENYASRIAAGDSSASALFETIKAGVDDLKVGRADIVRIELASDATVASWRATSERIRNDENDAGKTGRAVGAILGFLGSAAAAFFGLRLGGRNVQLGAERLAHATTRRAFDVVTSATQDASEIKRNVAERTSRMEGGAELDALIKASSRRP